MPSAQSAAQALARAARHRDIPDLSDLGEPTRRTRERLPRRRDDAHSLAGTHRPRNALNTNR
jgi:hypothetical protein